MSHLIESLNSPDNDKTTTLKLLQESAINGFDTPTIDSLLNLVFTKRVSVSQRLFLVKNVIVPTEPLLPTKYIYRILSSVGVEEIHYKDGRVQKLAEFIPISLQVPILEWLLGNLHSFGRKVYTTLQQLLTVMVNLLSYEYLRSPVTNLIFCTIMSSKLVKDWHVEFVKDLHRKFPMDDSLKCLLLAFKLIGVYGISTDFDSVNTTSFRVPSIKRITDFDNSITKEIDRYYNTFQSRYKKRKTAPTNSEYLDVIDFGNGKNVSIQTITSLRDMVNNFQNISHINLNDFLDNIGILEKYYVVLKGDKDKLDYFVRLALLDDSLSLEQLEHLTGNLRALSLITGDFHLKLIDDLVLGRLILAKPITWKTRLDLLCALSTDADVEVMIEKYLHELNEEPLKKTALDGLFMLTTALAKFWKTRKPTSGTIRVILKYISGDVQKHVFSVLKIFVCIKLLNEENLEGVREVLVPEPSIIYGLILCCDPFVVSETCGYLAFIKKLDLEGESKELLNTYIMDIINFMWRDRAFHYEKNTYNSGFMLLPTFIGKLNKLATFNFSEMVSPNVIGNFFANPTWCFLSSQVIWKLEDEQEVDIRHEGPIRKESVDSLRESGEWLQKTYDNLRVEVLNELDRLGFHGLADLMFGSLKTLQDKRRIG